MKMTSLRLTQPWPSAGPRVLGTPSAFEPSRLPLPAPMTMGRMAHEYHRPMAGDTPSRGGSRGPLGGDPLTLGIITDVHFGPEARWQGKLRKLTHLAGELTADFVRRMNDEVKPDLVVNLGDDIEDESREADLRRYGECQAILRGANAELVNVAGNHDLIHMNRDGLCHFWQRTRPLYYASDKAGWHCVVLHTVEKQDVEVRVPETQIPWLRDDLAAGTAPVIVL